MQDVQRYATTETEESSDQERTYLFKLSWGGACICNLGLAFLGPVGRTPSLFAVLCVVGVVSAIGMARYAPETTTTTWRWCWLWAPAIVLRIFFVGVFPACSDLSRYIVEGAVQWAGINPYIVPPMDSVAAASMSDTLGVLLKTVNHANMTAIYPPGALLLFRGVAGIQPSPLVFKAVMAIFELATCLVVSRLLILRQKRMSAIALCLFHPLLLVYGAGEGHLDAVLMFFWMLSLLAFETKRSGWGYFTLGMAAMIKYPAMVALPFYLTAKNIRYTWLCALPVLLFVPFASAGGQIFSSLGAFALHMAFNDSLMVILRALFGSSASLAGIVTLFLMLLWIWVFVQDRIVSVFAAMGAFLLVSPSLHPWYLMSMVVMLPLVPSVAWGYLSAAVTLTFPTVGIEYRTGLFHEHQWIKFFEYIPFYALFVFSRMTGSVRRLFPEYRFAPVRSLSVLIPTRNEAKTLHECLHAVRKSLIQCNLSHVAEIVVIDAGSTDKTTQIATEEGCRVLSSPAGRGKQIAAGVAATTGDVILIVHSDCRIAPEITGSIFEAMQNDSISPGGACAMQFLPRRRRMRVVEFLNDMRVRLTGIAFGDQAQFVRREALSRVGGFPALLLMEDVELALRIQDLGPCRYPAGTVRVLARTWDHARFSFRFVFIIRLFLEYLVCRRLKCVSPDAGEFCTRYYGPDAACSS
ncbi:glycosyltransferase [Desulfovibrio inopinatus]|uniref:glycosyltransferase n=1 Tax=Desulfovibrio inopinatus TaxID=102109 RepID=UPI00040E1F66|nr:glycosyltransferase [Desulfovibrio inopinatus]